ncbi:MAG TPA: ABC transporter permease [Dehalococcoidia bacterium]|nr:ABC transporter permease [Dehalococcoidia bacterium]
MIALRTGVRYLALALPPLALLTAAIAGWELYVQLSGINPTTLPAPSRIFDSAVTARADLWDNGLTTLREAVIGLGVSVALGVLFALAIDQSGTVRRALYPLLVTSQTIPIVAIAPLLVLWFGFDLTPKIIVVALYTFFPITVAFASGLAATDREAMVLLHTLGASRLQALRILRIPFALPYLFTGLRIGVTYAVVGAVFGEWSGAREGLGIYMLLTKNSFRTDLVFAAIFVTAGLSLLLFLAVGLLERLLVRWR